MSEIVITLDQLRGMIGLEAYHQGIACQVIEVLEDGPSLVLQAIALHGVIQPNQHGDPSRRVPQTFTVQVLTDSRRELHPEYLALDLIDLD